MGMHNIFYIAGSGMNAQMVRMNTVASNLANAQTMSGSADEVYKERQPVFETVMQQFSGDDASAAVQVTNIVESDNAAIPHYMPQHPLANEDGYVFSPGINSVEEMANMISASRSYQNNVEVLTTAKEMLLSTLRLGQG